MRWCFDAGAHTYADNVLAQLAPGGGAFVPPLWRYEVSAVLARAQNAGAITAEKVINFLANIAALNIVVDAEGSNRILTDVHQLALAHQLTSYDAACLELALRPNLPLASLDGDLKRACLKAGGTLL
jgi:predicted nucleic acid-binding protein